MELDLSAEGAAVAAERYVAARMGFMPAPEAVAFLDDLFDEHTEAMLEVKSLRAENARLRADPSDPFHWSDGTATRP